jgi:hypothetical protein
LAKRNASKKLSLEELEFAEQKLIMIIQKEDMVKIKAIKTLPIFEDSLGVMRIKTLIVQREELEAFRYPALLPNNHKLVRRLVKDMHEQHFHAGVGFIMTKLRERYWLLKTRRTIQSVIWKCLKCRRYCAKPMSQEPGGLPVERVQGSRAFETVGVDLAGPLMLKSSKKVWVVVFTCALYRAVHLQLVTSLRTKTFLSALRNFIRVHGRPITIYSDNGTNFHGANNLFKTIDWSNVTRVTDVQQIKWKFNIPTAPWWGGW